MRFFINTCFRFFYSPILRAFVFAFITCSASFAQSDELTSALNQKMKYLSQNQSVISKNLANAHTPKYKALELKEPKHGGGNSHSINLATTSPMHISSVDGSGKNFRTTKQKDAYETAPNGNNVSIEEQMFKMSKNTTEHQEVTALAKKINNLMALSVGGN